MMNKKWKARWLKALRSGEYKQGRGYMYIKAGETDNNNKATKSDRYCCLGVLTNEMDGWNKYGKAQRLATDIVNREPVLGGAYCPREAGLTDAEKDHLANMNDGNKTMMIERSTFKQIADWIEKNL